VVGRVAVHHVHPADSINAWANARCAAGPDSPSCRPSGSKPRRTIARLLDRPHHARRSLRPRGPTARQQREAGAGCRSRPSRARVPQSSVATRKDQHPRPFADGQDGRLRARARPAGGMKAGRVQRVEGLAESGATPSRARVVGEPQQWIPAAASTPTLAGCRRVVDARAGPRCLGGVHRRFQIEDPRVRTHRAPIRPAHRPRQRPRDVTR